MPRMTHFTWREPARGGAGGVCMPIARSAVEEYPGSTRGAHFGSPTVNAHVNCGGRGAPVLLGSIRDRHLFFLRPCGLHVGGRVTERRNAMHRPSCLGILRLLGVVVAVTMLVS